MNSRTEKLNKSISTLQRKITDAEKELSTAVLSLAEGKKTAEKPESIRKRLNLLKDQLSDLELAIPTARERDEADAKAAQQLKRKKALHALPQATAKQVNAAQKVEKALNGLDKALNDYKTADTGILELLRVITPNTRETMYKDKAKNYVSDRIKGIVVKSLFDRIKTDWDELLYFMFSSSDKPRPKPESLIKREQAQAEDKRGRQESIERASVWNVTSSKSDGIRPGFID